MSEGSFTSPVSDGAAALNAAFSGGGESTTEQTAESTTQQTSVPAGQNVAVPQNQTAGNQQQQSSGGHPAWQDILAKIPEGFHGIVRPAFEEWDQNVQKRFEQVHSQYAPYKQFLDNGVESTTLGEAWQLYQLLQNDPETVYNSIADHFGFGGEQGQEASEDEYDLGDSEQQQIQDPRIEQLAQQQQALIAGMEQAKQAAEEREAEDWLDSQIKSATATLNEKQIPVTDDAWRFILSTAAATGNGKGDQTEAFNNAVQGYISMVDSVRSAPRANASAPMVLPTSGGTPSSAVSPNNMTDKERRNLGAEWLAQALKE